ncbi:MAG: 1,4-alpha-glucan branching protein GlgB, partial [Vicinamibacteraceae bacterium]|nr:1,4-alpha-glucan branching protein GlgB [Vicinamibacteraceae bacterium]
MGTLGLPLAQILDRVAGGSWADTFGVIGPHLETRGGATTLVVRTFQPHAAAVTLLRLDEAGGELVMQRVHPAGIFEVVVPGVSEPVAYRLRLESADGGTREIDDAYRFPRVLGDLDLYLFGEGRHVRAFERLGAHVMTLDGVDGVHFAVWAPGAERVSVVGDFNTWDGRVHQMRALVPNGLWEIFVPGIGHGEAYKYEIRSRGHGAVFLRADPYARYWEHPPKTASVVWDSSRYQWRDADWMRERPQHNHWFDRPMSCYEVHLGSWMRGDQGEALSYRDLAARLVPYARDMGFTHLELLPVMEHPFAGSWGYQVTGFFAPTSRFGTPEDFKYFVDECHLNGLAVILDWVPGHFPKDEHGLGRYDGTALYEHEDPRQGEHTDWGTYVFNYGRNEVRNFLLSNALFWLEEFHVDGLRVDAVASMLYLDYSRQPGEWVPNRYGGRENIDAVDFLRQMNELTHAQAPGSITIAEESTAWPAVSRPVYVGGLGFTFKWNMGWMHDILEYMKKDPVHRRWGQNLVTFSMLYAWSENFVLPFSHDEVVHGKASMIGKMPGDDWQKAANLRALYGYMYAHPGKKLLFMGGEFGQWLEWNHDVGLPWAIVDERPHAGIRRFVQDLNHLYRREPSLHQVDFDPAGFQWIDCNDAENSVFSLLRSARDPQDVMVVVLNFTPIPRAGYRIGVPFAGRYTEVLNSDAEIYGGSNLGNAGLVETEPVGAHGHAQSLRLILPPLSCIMLRWQR